MIKLLKSVITFIIIAGVSSAIGQQISGGGGGCSGACTFTSIGLGNGTTASPAITFAGTQGISGNNSIGNANIVAIKASSDEVAYFNAGEFDVVSNTAILWGNQVNTFTGSSPDTGIKRNAAGAAEINNGSGCSTVANCRELILRSVISKGAVPGISGCSAGTQTGGQTAGTFTIGAATCNVTLTFAFTTPTGWSCYANDRTTAAAAGLVHETSSSTTTAVIAVPATAAASDVIDFHCMGY